MIKMISYFRKNSFFVFIFIYTLLIGVLFQQIILPMMPSMHAGSGILKGDNELFHHLALKMMEDIKNNGWEAWRLFPSGEVAGGANVGIATVLYYLIFPSPLVLLPLNAFLHTLSAFFLGRIIDWKNEDMLSRNFSALVFTLFPVTLIWTSQLHKDNYAILAWMQMFYVLMLIKEEKSFKKIIALSFCFLTIMLFIRPQYIEFMGLILFLNLIFHLAFSHPRKNKKLILKCLFLLFISFFFLVLSKILLRVPSIRSNELYAYKVERVIEGKVQLIKKDQRHEDSCSNYEWDSSKKFQWVDSKFKSMAGIRIRQICEQPEAASSYVDKDFLPSSIWDIVSYTPRALIVGLFFPNPEQLWDISTIKAKVALFEMMVYYFFLIFLIFGIAKGSLSKRYLNILVLLIFSMTFLSLISPNMGTLHRIRYPFLAIMMSLGISVFIEFLRSYNILKRGQVKINEKQ